MRPACAWPRGGTSLATSSCRLLEQPTDSICNRPSQRRRYKRKHRPSSRGSTRSANQTEWELDRSDWLFPASFLPTVTIGRLKIPMPPSEMRMPKPDVLITPMDRTSGAIAALAGQIAQPQVASRTLPDTWFPTTWKTELAKRYLFRAIDGAKVPGHDAASMAGRYGLTSERIWEVTQSIDLDLYRKALDFTPVDITKRKRELGLNQCTFIYVGRLWRGKGIDFLIDAFTSFNWKVSTLHCLSSEMDRRRQH